MVGNSSIRTVGERWGSQGAAGVSARVLDTVVEKSRNELTGGKQSNNFVQPRRFKRANEKLVGFYRRRTRPSAPPPASPPAGAVWRPPARGSCGRRPGPHALRAESAPPLGPPPRPPPGAPPGECTPPPAWRSCWSAPRPTCATTPVPSALRREARRTAESC
eukprot:1183730-Prorocentrum_minimum.AAC.1